MTLDITQFIDSKGGNAEDIRESQRKRGHSVELVDEIIQMYADWVKSMSYSSKLSWICIDSVGVSVEFETNGLSKQVNAVQKEIGAKKKVWCV